VPEHQDRRRPRCGHSPVDITVRQVPLITISACSVCERRAWRVNGASASIEEVLTVLRALRLYALRAA